MTTAMVLVEWAAETLPQLPFCTMLALTRTTSIIDKYIRGKIINWDNRLRVGTVELGQGSNSVEKSAD